MKDSSDRNKGAKKVNISKKGQSGGLVNMLKEIKRKDRALVRQEQFNNDILDTVPEGIAYTTLSGKVLYVNPALETISEIPKEDLIGKKLTEIISSYLDPSDHEYLISKISQLLSRIKVDPFQIRYRDKILEVSTNISLRTKRITGTIRDITENIRIISDYRKVQELLIEKNKDLSRLFDITLNLMESIEKNTLIQRIADQAANLVGTDTSAIYLLKDGNLRLQATCPQLPENFPDELRFACLENHPHIQKVIETGVTSTVSDCSKGKWTAEELTVISTRNLGSLVYIPLFIQKTVAGVIILGTIKRTHEYNQHEIDLFTIYSNITSLALENSYLFENLITTKEKAEESNRLKTAFLHNISHEIRTPLNAIIGFSDLLGNENIKPEIRAEYINIISQSNNQLLSIIDDILDISYIEAKQINLNKTEIEINTVLRSIYRQYLPEAIHRKLEFRLLNELEESNITFISDEAKIIGILTNLLNNAFKFTHKGSVEFGCRKKGTSVQFFVRDTGIGIPVEEQSKIFERFYKIDKGYDKIYGGMGLGLSICAAYADLLGGTITVESEICKGSHFTVSIPFEGLINKTVPSQKIISEIKKDHESKKILVAEDDDTNFAFISAVLQESGYKTIRALNGLDAIQICANQPDISLILMDVRMPVKDGYSSAFEISRIRPQLPIIFQTAYGYPEDPDQISLVDHNRFLNKPFTGNQLATIVENTLKANPGKSKQK